MRQNVPQNSLPILHKVVWLGISLQFHLDPLILNQKCRWRETQTGGRVKGSHSKSDPRKWAMFVSAATCAGQWYPMVYVFHRGVSLCFDVSVSLWPCCSPPPGSLSQLFSRQLLRTSRAASIGAAILNSSAEAKIFAHREVVGYHIAFFSFFFFTHEPITL